VQLLLALAGLLRPEAWLLSGAYLVWVLAQRGRPDRARLVALAASGPALWLLCTLVVTGSALRPFTRGEAHDPRDAPGLPEPGSRTGLLAVPDAFTRSLGNFLAPVPLALAVAGLVTGVVWLKRRTLLPLALAVLNTAAFAGIGLVGLSVEQRYLFASAAMLSLFAGLAVAGWVTLGPGRARRTWSVAGTGARPRPPARRRRGDAALAGGLPADPTTAAARRLLDKQAAERVLHGQRGSGGSERRHRGPQRPGPRVPHGADGRSAGPARAAGPGAHHPLLDAARPSQRNAVNSAHSRSSSTHKLIGPTCHARQGGAARSPDAPPAGPALEIAPSCGCRVL
jgi:hypothetical protein